MSSFCKASITTVRYIIDLDKKCYISVEVLSLRVGINSIRIVSYVMKQIISSHIKVSWQRCINAFFNDDSYQFSEYDPDVTLSVLLNHDELTLACAGKKAFYNYHSALQTADDNLPGRRLCNTIFGLNSEPLTYARPVAKRNGDIQWRILQGALASCRRLR